MPCLEHRPTGLAFLSADERREAEHALNDLANLTDDQLDYVRAGLARWKAAAEDRAWRAQQRA
jgi:hypothetical protein